jgi:pimeloyl-ACP methyl ester carboxylesterase
MSEINKSPDEIILVHGTFAANVFDEGDAWWQIGSSFDKYLRKDLETVAKPTPTPFHWSGGNTDNHRHIAAAKLYERLRSTKPGQVHLIGHSHGGTVILYALQLAIENGDELPNLRSWTTIGSPFLHLKYNFARMVIRDLLDFTPHMILLMAAQIFIVSAIANFIKTEISINVYLASLIPNFIFVATSWRSKSKLAQKLEEITSQVARIYGDRWLGVMSRHDEALGLLQRAIAVNKRFPKNILPRIKTHMPRWKYFHPAKSRMPGLVAPVFTREPTGVRPSEAEWKQQTASWLIFAAVYWPFDIARELFRLTCNQVLLAWADRRLIRFSARRALGNDSPYFRTQYASSFPFPARGVLPELEPQIENELINLTRLGSQEIFDEARKLFAHEYYVSTDRQVPYISLDLDLDPTGSLVHNQYFHVDKIRALISEHIRLSATKRSQAKRKNADAWISGFKAKIRESVSRLDEKDGVAG